MNRPLRSMRRPKRCWPISCAPISPAADSLSLPPRTDRIGWGKRAAAGAAGSMEAAAMTALCALLVRDMRLAVRVGGGAWIGVLFFLIVVTLVPFAIGPDLALLARIGPAILWLGALLASLLALDRLVAMDHEDGSLDLIL